MTFIESGIALDEIARAVKSPVAVVEAEALELDLYVGENWSGAPALSETDAYGIVSGAARRAQDATVSWRAHAAALEAHESDRENVRVGAFRTAYDNSMRRGVGNSASTTDGHDAARAAMHDFDAANRPPTFNGASTSPASWIKTRVNKVKAAVS